MNRQYVLVVAALTVCGCCTARAASLGEEQSGYTYVPIDSFAVQQKPGMDCDKTAPNYLPLLQSLPDNSVRMLIEQFDASGKVVYGPAAVAANGGTYRVTVDYTNADTVNKELWIKEQAYRRIYEQVSDKSPKVEKGLEPADVPFGVPLGPDYVSGSESYTVRQDPPAPADAARYTRVNLPVYIGIGLRAAATVTVLNSKANISGIGIIGAEAEINNLKGALTVQTLGVNGKSVAAALPIQSELNRTTAQNAIVAVGAIKALLYAADETVVSPRIVGLYLPYPGGKPLVNAIISELSSKQIPWDRPCRPPTISLAAVGASRQIALSWNGAGQTFTVLRSVAADGTYSTVGSSSAQSYADTQLADGVTFYYKVIGPTSSSNIASATTIPPAPTNLAAAGGKLSWTPSVSATSYNVLRSTTHGNYQVVASLTEPSYAFTNTGLTAGTTYYFVVQAKNAAGFSPNSDEVTVVAP